MVLSSGYIGGWSRAKRCGSRCKGAESLLSGMSTLIVTSTFPYKGPCTQMAYTLAPKYLYNIGTTL